MAKLRPVATPDAATASQVLLATAPGVVMGTVAYMSPEQARGQDVDGRTDIWSLGVVLYEMLTGRRPFEGDSPSHTMVALLDREPWPLERHLPGTPTLLQEIVSNALTKERAARYQTAKEMLEKVRWLKRAASTPASLSISPATSSQATTAIST